MTALDHLATATYAAMIEPPPFVQLATALLAAETRAERDALLRETDPATRAEALRYAAEPEHTRERDRRLEWMRADPRRVAALRHYYRHNIANFISDYGFTSDPRMIARGKPALVPFALWPKQRELVGWMIERWRGSEPGVVVKSRDVGASWVAMALLASLCIFEQNFAAGVASATEAKLDRSGDPDTLFHKLREFLRHLPPEFSAGYVQDKHSAYLRVSFPDTGSSITGEAGDQAGRGARKSLYIVDEAAHFERPKAIDAALAATTDCRIDMSSVNGIGNSFYERAHNPAIPRFDITWRDDPRKDAAWYADKVATLDPVIVAQEIDCNFSASVEAVIIPQLWVQAAIDAHLKLTAEFSGEKIGALDVADEGRDRNAFAARHGNIVTHVESWSGEGSDLFATAERACLLCERFGLGMSLYDADGLGAGIRGDAERINARRDTEGRRVVEFQAFRGSASVLFPERKVPGTDCKTKDYFQNLKAQGWFSLRERFRNTYMALNGQDHDAANLISLSSDIPELSRLCVELSQPQWKQSASGRVAVDKAPQGSASPNLSDSVMMLMAPRKMEIVIDPSVFDYFPKSMGSAW